MTYVHINLMFRQVKTFLDYSVSGSFEAVAKMDSHVSDRSKIYTVMVSKIG